MAILAAWRISSTPSASPGVPPQVPQNARDHVRLGRVSAGKRAVARSEDHRLHLRRKLVGAATRERVLDPLLDGGASPSATSRSSSVNLFAIRMQIRDRAPECDRWSHLGQDLGGTVLAQVGIAVSR